ncbi:uncharacterized protein LOC124358454 [Homalodisca vitripennis]|uniref:uncharacterized protein LOC124358453 n=2 Tax=Homalodisca vitripennis TaxID=197043 RepID=UPI001EEAD265|nr:uncharacterized protein LOC124358453 [Homalodisca vitripennis]XP_046666706.1 uncharacterized protein LOC124358454 [Homalodisca vitripennis]
MPVNCSVCNSACDGEPNLVRCAENCGAVCHLNCVPQKTRSSKKDWICNSCKPESSSVASSKSAGTTTISKEFLVNTIEAFKKEMLKELKKIATENVSLSTSLSFLNTTVEESNKLMENVRKELKKTQEDNLKLQKENLELRNNVSNLEVRVRNLEQYSRKQNIEIDGVPESNNEDVYAIIHDVGRAIGVELKRERVVAAHRIPSFNKKRTPPIIVRFSTFEEKDVWISSFRNVRPLTANKINPRFNLQNKVFINEHLSPENKQLLSRTKEAAKTKGYKYVWTRDGKIFVRRGEGEKCKKVDTFADLDKL